MDPAAAHDGVQQCRTRMYVPFVYIHEFYSWSETNPVHCGMYVYIHMHLKSEQDSNRASAGILVLKGRNACWVGRTVGCQNAEGKGKQ